MDKYIPCSKCDNGWIIILNEYGVDEAKKCSCLEKYQKDNTLEISLKKSNIPMEALDYTIRSYIGKQSLSSVKKLQKYIKKYKQTFYNKHIYLYGSKGTQKTTLSWWVGRELLKKGVTVKYILMNDLIKELQDDNFKDESSIDQYYNVDCLIIDRSFSKEQITLYKSGYQLPFLDNFLRKRIDQLQKSIIFISNINIYEIAENGFTKDIEDLIVRKIKVFNSDFLFEDHYSIKDDFDTIDLWS